MAYHSKHPRLDFLWRLRSMFFGDVFREGQVAQLQNTVRLRNARNTGAQIGLTHQNVHSCANDKYQVVFQK